MPFSPLGINTKKTRKTKSRKSTKKSTSNATIKDVKRIVKKETVKNIETKFITAINPQTSFNSAIASSAELYPFMPSLGKGVESYQRVGDVVKGSYLKVSGYIRMTTPSAMPQPLTAYIYFIEDMLNKDGNSLTADAYQFLNMNGTPTAFDGGFGTAVLPVDTSRFRLIKKIRVKLTQNYVNNVAVAPSVAQITDPSGTIYKQFSFKIPLKGRLLRYRTSATGTTQPENCNMFWAAGYVNYDQTADFSLTGMNVQIASQFWYKDA